MPPHQRDIAFERAPALNRAVTLFSECHFAPVDRMFGYKVAQLH